MVSALLEFACVVLLSRVPGSLKRASDGGTSGKGIYSKDARFFRSKVASKQGLTFSRFETGKEQAKDWKCMKLSADMPPIFVVDLYAFCIYILFFILFNGIYWIRYLM